jgi:hypothetical protein
MSRNKQCSKRPQLPFPCPECRRQGQNDDIWIDGFVELHHHAASAHSEFELPEYLFSSSSINPPATATTPAAAATAATAPFLPPLVGGGSPPQQQQQQQMSSVSGDFSAS